MKETSGAGQRRRGNREAAVLAWMRLVRVEQRVARATGERVRQSGLSGAQFDVLAHVGANEGRAQQDLAQALLVTKGNVTQILDRMESCGLVERRQVGRSKCIFLTARGRELYRCLVPEVEEVVRRAMGALSPAEQRDLLRLLRAIDHDLSRRGPGAGDVAVPAALAAPAR